METLNRLNLTDLITRLHVRAHAHTARTLANAHSHSWVRSRPPHPQRLHALAARLTSPLKIPAAGASAQAAPSNELNMTNQRSYKTTGNPCALSALLHKPNSSSPADERGTSRHSLSLCLSEEHHQGSHPASR